MKSSRQRVFLLEQCFNCRYQFEEACLTHLGRCKGCPMYFKPRSDKTHHCCHCLAPVTIEERKSGKCKFFKQKGENK